MNQSVFNQFPVLKVSDDISLRELKHTDALALKNILEHPKVAPFIPNDVIPSNITQALNEINFLKNLFHQKKSIYWGIEHIDHGLIGSAGFESWHAFHNRLELAFELHPDHWQRGIMTNCLHAITDYAFDIMQANRIDAYTLENNFPSHKVLNKVGFKLEGCLQKYRKFNGEFVNITIFGLTNKNND